MLIVAEGELPSPGFTVVLEHSAIDIFPPQFDLVACPPSGFVAQVLTPFKHSQTVAYSSDQQHVTVHHADGSDDVAIEDCDSRLEGYTQALGGGTDEECPEQADVATGFSRKLSFDEALADALARLAVIEPPGPDALASVRVLEVGALFGGIAGFHDVYVRVCRVQD
ncbi:MAG TPA: hypothetical protein VK988_08185 [Acidimicrobiales bacterium]|nr:hypothetical protein [Acidimicrobiales bacterium]